MCRSSPLALPTPPKKRREYARDSAKGGNGVDDGGKDALVHIGSHNARAVTHIVNHASKLINLFPRGMGDSRNIIQRAIDLIQERQYSLS
jgi:hypothetical protein